MSSQSHAGAGAVHGAAHKHIWVGLWCLIISVVQGCPGTTFHINKPRQKSKDVEMNRKMFFSALSRKGMTEVRMKATPPPPLNGKSMSCLASSWGQSWCVRVKGRSSLAFEKNASDRQACHLRRAVTTCFVSLTSPLPGCGGVWGSSVPCGRRSFVLHEGSQIPPSHALFFFFLSLH